MRMAMAAAARSLPGLADPTGSGATTRLVTPLPAPLAAGQDGPVRDSLVRIPG